MPICNILKDHIIRTVVWYKGTQYQGSISRCW